MSTAPPRIIPSYPHSQGLTKLAYSHDGRFLITAGADQLIRKFTVDEESKEPETFEQHTEPVVAVAASKDGFASASEDCTVNLFNMRNSNDNVKLLTRCTLPVRDIAFSPDGEWLGVASEETNAKIVNTISSSRVRILRGHSKSVKHITFHPNGNLVTTSCSDGSVYVFSITSEEATLLKKIEGIIPAVDVESETSSKVAWHPDGSVFAAPTEAKDIQLVAMDGWEKGIVFKNGHAGSITDLAWSSNGAYLATSGADGKVHIWQTKDQTIVTTYTAFNVVALAWHPAINTLSFTTFQGQLYRWKDCIPSTHPASFGSVKCVPLNNHTRTTSSETSLSRSPSILSRTHYDQDDMFEEDDDFIVDDDGAGYVPAYNRKRNGEWGEEPVSKRGRPEYTSSFRVKPHPPFQSGSTPWKGNRRYLTCNMIGHVWTVDQDTHNTVTCEFYDREAHHQFFFTDPYLYDKACLNDYATLFASSGEKGGSMLFYRPHEIEGTARADWRVEMPAGEIITSIALSHSHVVACTSKGYVRVYTIQGTPVRLYRQKYMPVVTCASWKNYIMVVGNGGALGDGTTELTYTIEDVLNDEIVQSGDTVALPPGGHLKSVFFSEEGDPTIFDSEGVLLVLMHWRKPGQARWVPLLDTKQLSETNKQTYWPISIVGDKFHCIVLKGEEKDPYFPRPLFSELEFSIPCHPKPAEQDSGSMSQPTLEERHLRLSILHSLLEDSVSSRSSAESRLELARKETEIDRTLLPLIQIACKEEKGSKAYELVKLLRKRASLEYAGKIAVKYGLKNVADKIGEIMMEED